MRRLRVVFSPSDVQVRSGHSAQSLLSELCKYNSRCAMQTSVILLAAIYAKALSLSATSLFRTANVILSALLERMFS